MEGPCHVGQRRDTWQRLQPYEHPRITWTRVVMSVGRATLDFVVAVRGLIHHPLGLGWEGPFQLLQQTISRKYFPSLSLSVVIEFMGLGTVRYQGGTETSY
ncbi:hypothetical protein FF2_034956 [Malus domestica]